MKQDEKEPAPIELVAKIVGGIMLGVFSVVLLGFAYVSEEARRLVFELALEIAPELVLGGLTIGAAKLFGKSGFDWLNRMRRRREHGKVREAHRARKLEKFQKRL